MLIYAGLQDDICKLQNARVWKPMLRLGFQTTDKRRGAMIRILTPAVLLDFSRSGRRKPRPELSLASSPLAACRRSLAFLDSICRIIAVTH